MTDFVAKVRNGPNITKQRIVAGSAKDAERIASRMGTVMSVKADLNLASMLQRGMSSDERVVFLRRMATMIRSRVGMGESLKLMRDQFRGPISRAAGTLYQHIEAGSDFGTAVTQMQKDFPATTAALINAGLKGGNIYAALQDSSSYEMEMEKIKRDSSRGLMSGIMSFLISAVIVLGTSMYLGPYVMESDLIKAAGDAVDVDWIFVVANYIAWIMGFITFIFVSLAVLGYVVKPIAPRMADKLILRIPVYRDLVLSQSYYTVFYGMSLLVRSGVRMEETLKLSGESAPQGEVREDILRALHAVKNGRPWPHAMHHLHPTDIAALSTSLDREQVADSLDAVSIQHKENYARRLQQVIPFLQMMSALFMTIGGGLIFGMVILPMLQMTQGVLA